MLGVGVSRQKKIFFRGIIGIFFRIENVVVKG